MAGPDGMTEREMARHIAQMFVENRKGQFLLAASWPNDDKTVLAQEYLKALAEIEELKR